jgi:hypothetical protein
LRNEFASSRASDTETLQSQVNKAAKKRLSLSGLEILHGRPVTQGVVEYGYALVFSALFGALSHAPLGGPRECR